MVRFAVAMAVAVAATVTLASSSSAFTTAPTFGVAGRAADACRDEVTARFLASEAGVEDVSVCVVGGGVSGLAAALTAAETADVGDVVLLEKRSEVGGRVRSVRTDDGHTLDVGFAVFIEEYPLAKRLLDYDELELGAFVPGSLVRTGDGDGALHKVADPLRVPSDILTAITAPVGTFADKIRVLPLLLRVFTTSVEDLFAEEETDTLTCLRERYGFSELFIRQFFKPFLEGIYLAPLDEQSSRMFHFVFKMFSEGSATLPRGGMGKVAESLASKATAAGVEIRTDTALSSLSFDDDGRVTVTTEDGKRVRAASVIVATEGRVAQQLLEDAGVVPRDTPTQTQRRVGNLYYSFEGAEPPVREPILVLNGAGSDDGPVNNICFPSAVTDGYAPPGRSLCSVTVLAPTLDRYAGDEDGLDRDVRAQLSSWFPDRDVANAWERVGPLFVVEDAQPSQLGGPGPASVHGGRDSATFRGADAPLPPGLLLCGDHTATATLNGALESGVRAGTAAAARIAQ